MNLFCLSLVFLATSLSPGSKELLVNPGFESDFAAPWEARTPADAQRSLKRTSDVAHEGRWSLLLQAKAAVPNRARQGQDRKIVVPPGSLLELSAWVRSAIPAPGYAALQLYCMGAGEKILAQPQLRADRALTDWQRLRLFTPVPPGTEYVMVYVQTGEAAGEAYFDEVSLKVAREPLAEAARPKVVLLSDLPPDDPCRKDLSTLFGRGLLAYDGKAGKDQFRDCRLALVLASAPPAKGDLNSIAAWVGEGGTVLMDLRAFAAWKGLKTERVRVLRPRPTMGDRMEGGPRVFSPQPLLGGMQPGQILPLCGSDGCLEVMAPGQVVPDLEVLARAAEQPTMLRLLCGKGTIYAYDVLSLPEPRHNVMGGYYKYLPISNALRAAGAGDARGFAEYYPRKLEYKDLVATMRQAAAELPGVRMEDEGAACKDYRIYSLNLGRPGAPLFFLYAATHGSEWEPGYGLLTLVRRLATGKTPSKLDLSRVAIKVVPILNPSGYDLRQRQNAHGVDLNRQGDYRWEEFSGRDRNKDGRYGPGDYDWKGDRPLSEPEAQVYRRIAGDKSLHCILDFHANSSATSNKLGVLPATARDDNYLRALDVQQRANRWLTGRHLLQQSDENEASPYLLDRVYPGGPTPFLMNTAARGRYGLLVELTGGYADSYGTLLQTEVTCAICCALLEAYWPE